MFLGVIPFSIAAAQGITGRITGRVVDADGLAVPGARVMLRNADTGQSREGVSGEDGAFVFVDLLPGRFALAVDLQGFKRWEAADIRLPPNERLVLAPVRLELGELTETVTVESRGTRVQTQSAERSGLIDSREMQALPLKGRDFVGTLKIVPGTYDLSGATRDAAGANVLNGLYFNGTRSGALNLTLDGISLLDTGGGTGPYIQPNMEAVSEVKVLLSNYQAEYGRSLGGTINAITKSGASTLRGGAYAYFRNEALNANEFFNNRIGAPRPIYRSNNPGYFLGGPVVVPGTHVNSGRNKLFFFWSHEYHDYTFPAMVQPTATGSSLLTNLTVPTPLERDGNFSRSFDQNGRLIVIRDPLTGLPFPGNVIPAGRIGRAGQSLLNLLPMPNASDPSNAFNYTFQATVDQPRHDRVLRVDWNIASDTQFYARGLWDSQTYRGGVGFALASTSWPQMSLDRTVAGKSYSGTLLHTFSSSKANELTVGMWSGGQSALPTNAAELQRNSRSSLAVNVPQFFPASNLLNVVPNATFGGVPNAIQLYIDGRFPYSDTNRLWNFSDNYTQAMGRHLLKAGVFVEHSANVAPKAMLNFSGTFAFDRDPNNPLDTGYAFANAMLGVVDIYSEANNRPLSHARDNSIEWYVQDTWKASRITLDTGVRFYRVLPTVSPDTQIAAFDPGLYDRRLQPPLIQPFIDPATNTRMGRDPVNGELLPAAAIGTFSSAAGTPFQGMRIHDESILPVPGIKLAPRVGLAWDVFGTGRTALRTGLGVFSTAASSTTSSRSWQRRRRSWPRRPPTTRRSTTCSPHRCGSAPTTSSPSPTTGSRTCSTTGAPASSRTSVAACCSTRPTSATPAGTRCTCAISTRSPTGRTPPREHRPDDGPTAATELPAPVPRLRQHPADGVCQHHGVSRPADAGEPAGALRPRIHRRLHAVEGHRRRRHADLAGQPGARRPRAQLRSGQLRPPPQPRPERGLQCPARWIGGADVWPARWSTAGRWRAWPPFISGAPTAIGYTLVTPADLPARTGAGLDSRVNLSCDPNLAIGETGFDRALDTSCVQAPTRADFGIGNAFKYRSSGRASRTWTSPSSAPLASAAASHGGCKSAPKRTTSSTGRSSRALTRRRASTPADTRSTSASASTSPRCRLAASSWPPSCTSDRQFQEPPSCPCPLPSSTPQPSSEPDQQSLHHGVDT